MSNSKLRIISKLAELPLVETHVIFHERVLLHRSEFTVLRDITEQVLVLNRLHGFDFFLSSARNDVGPCVLWERQLGHLLVGQLRLLDGSDLVHVLDALHLGVFDVLHSGSSQSVLSVFHLRGYIISLIRRQELYAFTIRTNNEDSWENEATNVRIALDADSLNIPLLIIAFVVSRWSPVLVLLEFVIGVFLELVQMIDLVEESSLAISDSQMDVFFFIANTSIVNTWIIGSIWDVMLL